MNESTFYWSAAAIGLISAATLVGMASSGMVSLFNKQADAINQAVQDINGVRPLTPPALKP